MHPKISFILIAEGYPKQYLCEWKALSLGQGDGTFSSSCCSLSKHTSLLLSSQGDACQFLLIKVRKVQSKVPSVCKGSGGGGGRWI